jgi:hypothetical protein
VSGKWDHLTSAEAWDGLVIAYEDFGGDDADDHTLAELLRRAISEVEG